MKINSEGNTCFQIFLHRCLLWLCCRHRDNDNTSLSMKVSHKNTEDTTVDLHVLELKQKIYDELCNINDGSWKMEDIKEAVSSCKDYKSAVQYLSHECQICCEKYPYSKFVKMTHCNCSFCELCFIHHFSSVIKEKSIIHVVCPICKKPDLENEGNTEESREYFNLLDTQIHHYLDSATHELFQSKLRDRALMEMPNFCWCSHCSFGVLHERDTLQMECPSCNKITCFNCKEQWEDIHELLSCEEFSLQKMQNTEEKLDDYLARNGIECPSCRFRFDLWKGGCLHFKCTQCQHDFCGGCLKPFYHGSKCGFFDDCDGKGLHAHHTRDCFYYLRDWDVGRLQQLLQHNKIQYKNDITKEQSGSIERFFKLRKTDDTHKEKREEKEDDASDEIENKEYLIKIINSNFLDPVDLYTEKEMKVELQRWNITIPENEDEDRQKAYLHNLQTKIKQEIPLAVTLDIYEE
ncbi:E3 ubiquitin-protein ligase RNF31-like [Hyla sarda]|uniref:E3 ubiquitin-protein ligase RNF31-like n=1 Tax=Hyla sarda TaxID=327740 RepID=UPI0024C2B3F9|nr:E3 ubiquitin-protein ligase RNF31-like [Hyla sarda]XP_056378238.1 E3 ubiquitin-protein ligase RNF31-like [Hyla sarda]XP_056378239.1 E3 ubiquitin-protein ligase RNF31-like [Hyla sarda]